MGLPDFNIDQRDIENIPDLLPEIEDIEEDQNEFNEPSSLHEEPVSPLMPPRPNIEVFCTLPCLICHNCQDHQHNDEEVVSNKSLTEIDINSLNCNEPNSRQNQNQASNQNAEHQFPNRSRRQYRNNLTTSHRTINRYSRRLRAAIQKCKKRQKVFKTFMWHTINSLDIIKSFINQHIEIIENFYQNQ